VRFAYNFPASCAFLLKKENVKKTNGWNQSFTFLPDDVCYTAAAAAASLTAASCQRAGHFRILITN